MAEQLTENYKKAYDNHLGFGDYPALILVDFVEGYFDQSCPLYADVGDSLSSALRIRDAARQTGLPIIYTRVEYQRGGLDGGVFFRKAPVLKHFVAGSPMGAWPQGLQPSAEELVIVKQYPSAFFGTSLASTLHVLGVDTLIITGLTTSGCVRATCIDSMSHGFVTIVVSDACGDRHSAPHDANLFDMDAKYADVVGEAAVLEYLSEQRNK